jgi:hypothetical protein
MLLIALAVGLALAVVAAGLGLIALFDDRFDGVGTSAVAQWSSERSPQRAARHQA